MMKKASFSVIFMLVVLLFTVQANASYSSISTFKVGDSFLFSISEFKNVYKINGTNYAPNITASNNPVGKSYNVTVSSITTATNPDFAASNQKIDYSVKYNGTTATGTTYADEWIVTLLGMLFVIGLGYTFANPQYADFSAPSSSSSGIGVSPSDLNNLPFFISSNTTLYQNITDTYHNYVNTSTTTVSSITAIESAQATTNTATNKTTLDFEFSGQKSSSTSSGAWSFSLQASYKLTLDLARGIVTDLYQSINLSESLGSANEQIQFLLHMVEGTVSTPGFEIILFIGVFASISAIVVVRRKMMQ